MKMVEESFYIGNLKTAIPSLKTKMRTRLSEYGNKAIEVTYAEQFDSFDAYIKCLIPEGFDRERILVGVIEPVVREVHDEFIEYMEENNFAYYKIG